MAGRPRERSDLEDRGGAAERAARPTSARVPARLALALGALLFALAALLWSPSWSAAARGRELRVVLVDASASVARARPSWAAWRDDQLRAEALAASELGEDLCVVAFAEGVEVAFGPGDAAEFAPAPNFGRSVGERESDLARALVALRAIAAERRVSRLCVLGDGEFSGADPSAELALWRAAGAQLEERRAPPAELVDLALARLRAPRELEVGAPLAVALELRSLAAPLPAGASVRITLDVVDRNGSRKLVRDLSREEFEARTGALALDVGPLAEGRTEVRASLEVEGALDAADENNSRSVSLRSRGALVVGVLAKPERDFGAWLEAGRDLAGLDVRALPEGELGEHLDDCDALVTLDLDPRELDRELVRDFVRRGGGWLAAGGASLLSGLAAGRADADLAALLPLTPEQGPTRDVLLLLDGSGSMQGEALEQLRRACFELARHAAPNERVQALWFTDTLLESLELARGVDEASRAANLASWARARRPGGPTDIARVLGELAARRAGEPAALALLVSDGRDQRARGVSAEELAQRVRDLDAAGVRLAVVASGPEADRAWLDELALATARGRAWSADETGLAEALVTEAARERVATEGGAVRAPTANADDEPEIAALREAFASVELPAAGAHWRAQAREGDRVALAVEGGAPFLALRRFGAGWCATWSSAPTAAWSPAWAADARSLAPLLRTLARGAPGAARSELRAEFDAQGGLLLRGCPLDWPAQVSVTGSAGGERWTASLPHDRNALDPRGLRVATLPPQAASDLANVERVVVTDAAGVELAQVRLEREPAVEFRAERPAYSTAEFGLPPGRGAYGGEPAPSHRRLGLLAALAGAGALIWGLALSSGSRRPSTGQVLPAPRR
jgi:hypothetical protein